VTEKCSRLILHRLFHYAGKQCTCLFEVFGVPIFLPWPEESFQSVSLGSWDHVHVEVRHALADAVIDRDECALRSHAFFHRNGKQARVCRDLLQQRRGNLVQRFYMLLRYQEAVAGKERPVIQESQRKLIFEDDRSWNRSADYLTESAGWHRVEKNKLNDHGFFLADG